MHIKSMEKVIKPGGFHQTPYDIGYTMSASNHVLCHQILKQSEAFESLQIHHFI